MLLKLLHSQAPAYAHTHTTLTHCRATALTHLADEGARTSRRFNVLAMPPQS